MSIRVIIVMYGLPKMTEDNTLRMLSHARRRLDVVVIDNNSPESIDGARLEKSLRDINETREIERRHTAEIVSMPENQGYPRGANEGLRIALQSDADLFCLANSDVEINHTGWDETMAGPIDEGRGHLTGFHHIRPRVEGDVAMEILPKHSYLGGFLMMGHRAVWETVGLYDELFGMGYYEDRDWCYRAQEAGFRLARLSGLDIRHRHNTSFDAAGTPSRVFARMNRRLFHEKWRGHRLNEHLGKEHDW